VAPGIAEYQGAVNDVPPRIFRIEAEDAVMSPGRFATHTNFWTRACLTVLSVAVLAGPAHAKDPGQDAYMIRMLNCTGPDATTEVYIPESVALDVKGMVRDLQKPVIGYYTLDLTSINKGKPLEPVKISMTADGKTVIVNQYTRGLPPTRIPVGGGTVDFDHRFGTAAKCGPFQAQDPNFHG
jgi:hypothetical protein